MRNTPNPLAQLLIDLQEGKKPSRWEIHERLVLAGIPSKRATETIAQAFPFPFTRNEFYAAGILWGSNYVPEEDAFHNLDMDGNPKPHSWGMRIIQDPQWIEQFFKPLRLKAESPDPETGMLRRWTLIYPDELMEAYFQELGIGKSRVNWNLIPEKQRHLFVAGIIDSTPVAVYKDDDPDLEDQEGDLAGNELILDANNYGLAHTISEGIPEACIWELRDNPTYDPNWDSWPYGVSIKGKGITWFINKVREKLYYSLIKEEKQKLEQFEYQNKISQLTGKRLTEKQKSEIQAWIKINYPVKAHDIAKHSEEIIYRTISIPAAWEILRKYKLEHGIK